jgi:SP family myo-inositol transporter-like MFS transporter 13
MSGVYDKTTAVWLAAITAMINFICTIISLFLVERIGRRLLTLASLAGVIFSLGILAIAFQMTASHSPALGFVTNSSSSCMQYTDCGGCIESTSCGFCFDDTADNAPNGTCLPAYEPEPAASSTTGFCVNGTKAQEKLVWAKDWCPSPYSWMTLLGLCIYLFFFAPGMGPMPWTINSEIFPLWARSVCTSTTTGFCWFFNMLVSLTFLSLTRAITKYGAFWLYATFGMFGFIFFYFNLPETKGKSMENTALLFGSANSRRNTRSYSQGSTNKGYVNDFNDINDNGNRKINQ